MFVHEYQGGAHVDVFTAQGSDPLKGWKVAGKPKKAYDKEVKSHVFELEGASKVVAPKDEKRGSLGLTQPFFVLQVKVPQSKGFSVEIGLLDATRKRRRIVCNAGNKETVSTALHARVPMGPIARGVWLNLCFDVRDMTARLWPGAEFQSIELVSVGAACKLRRMATMRGAPVDTTDDDVRLGCDRTLWQSTPVEELPKSFHFLPGVKHINQIFHMHKLYAWEAQQRGEAYAPSESGAFPAAAAAATGGLEGAGSPAKFPAARREVATASPSAAVAFGRRVEATGGRPPSTARSLLKTPGTAPKTAPAGALARKGAGRGSRRSPVRAAGDKARARTAGLSQRPERERARRSPLREARKASRQEQRRTADAAGGSPAARAQGSPLQKQASPVRAAVQESPGAMDLGVQGMGRVSPSPQPFPNASVGSSTGELDTRDLTSPMGGGWGESSEPSYSPQAKAEAQPVRESTQLRQQDIERKRAHLARLEESYAARFGGRAAPAPEAAVYGSPVGAGGGGLHGEGSSHAGSVAEELVEYADSLGTGYEEDGGEGSYDRGRYSGEAEPAPSRPPGAMPSPSQSPQRTINFSAGDMVVVGDATADASSDDAVRIGDSVSNSAASDPAFSSPVDADRKQQQQQQASSGSGLSPEGYSGLVRTPSRPFAALSRTHLRNGADMRRARVRRRSSKGSKAWAGASPLPSSPQATCARAAAPTSPSSRPTRPATRPRQGRRAGRQAAVRVAVAGRILICCMTRSSAATTTRRRTSTTSFARSVGESCDDVATVPVISAISSIHSLHVQQAHPVVIPAPTRQAQGAASRYPQGSSPPSVPAAPPTPAAPASLGSWAASGASRGQTSRGR